MTDIETHKKSTGQSTEQSTQPAAVDATNTVLELAKLYYERGDFGIAIEKYNTAADAFFAVRDFKNYLQCQNTLLRMYAEKGDTENIHLTKERLQDLVLKEGFDLSARTYYTLGICASYKNQLDIAIDYFQKSLSIALANDDKESICYAIYSIGATYYSLDRLHDALKEVYNLQIFFQVMDLPDLKLSSHLLNGLILRKMKKFDQALEILWECYDQTKTSKNMFVYLGLLRHLGMTYKDAGEFDLARLYLRLARKSIDPASMTMMAQNLDGQLAELGDAGSEEFDLIFDGAGNFVTEKKKGRIDFKNQFILLDMLRLFMKQPGTVYSKELLVRQVWKQDYDPIVHDNKIYVTIKRLRKLIEPDFDKPKYIFRAKNGYYLNKTAKIHVQSV